MFRIALQGIRKIVNFEQKMLGAHFTNLNPTRLYSSQNICLTDKCVERIKQVVPNGEFLRLSLEGGGCSGFQYKFAIDSETNADDKVFEKNGAKLVIDETSYEYLKGCTVDYHVELIRSSFRVADIPQAEHGCSCGTSFTFKQA